MDRPPPRRGPPWFLKPPGWPPTCPNLESLERRFGDCTERHGGRLSFDDQRIDDQARWTLATAIMHREQVTKTARALETAGESVARLVRATKDLAAHLYPLPPDIRAEVRQLQSLLDHLPAALRREAERYPFPPPLRNPDEKRKDWSTQLLAALRRHDVLKDRLCRKCAAFVLRRYCGKARNIKVFTPDTVRDMLGRLGLPPFPADLPDDPTPRRQT